MNVPQQRTRRPAPATPVPAYFLFGEPLQAPDERLIHIETLAARSALHDWEISAHRHRDLHQVLLLRRGRADVRLDGRDSVLRGAGAIVVPAGTVHSFRFKPHSDGFVVSFATTLSQEFAPSIPGLPSVLESATCFGFERESLKLTDLSALGPMMLREHGRAARGRHGALRGLLATLLANLLRLVPDHTASRGAESPSADRELVARLRQLVEQTFREQLSVAAYARMLGVNSIRLRRACLAGASQSPIHLIHARLMVEAERQLRYTSMSVAQIAYYLGFADPAYFTRFFSRRRRMSPKAFRADGGSGMGH
jgi:AraC family transcriptional regulator, transcriptional activator of pobA